MMNTSPETTVYSSKKGKKITFASMKVRQKLINQIKNDLIDYKKIQTSLEEMKTRRKEMMAKKLMSAAKGGENRSKKLVTFEKISQWKSIINQDEYVGLIDGCLTEVETISD